MVLAPEHALVADADRTRTGAPRSRRTSRRPRRRTEIERLSTDREKTGVAIGADAINPVNGERIPIWIADYVLAGYGTGAIMAVPAHDERDFAFAQRFGLPIRRVVAAPGTDADARSSDAYIAHADGERLVNSGPFDGLPADEGGTAIVARLAETGPGGADGHLSLARLADQPPALLGHADPGHLLRPTTASSRSPTRTCRSCCPRPSTTAAAATNPLNHDEAFLQRRLPALRRARPGARPTRWTRSSTRPGTGIATCRRTRTTARSIARWSSAGRPVDQYTGGAEHAVMHLLYSRFFTKAMRDLGLVASDEPFTRLFNQGQILGADGERMSKSRGNVEDPDELVPRYGADTVRLFLMFMGPWDQGGPWSPTGIGGVHRFLNRVWTLALDPHGREPGDPDVGHPAGRRDEATAARGASGRPPIETLRDVTADYEALPLQHDGRQAHGAGEHAVPLPRHGRRRRRGVGRGDPPAAADAGAGGAAHHRGAVVRHAGRGRRAVDVDPHGVLARGRRVGDVEATREVPVQVNGKLRDRVIVPADIDAADSRPRSWRTRRSSRSWAAGRRTGSSGRRRPARQHRAEGRLSPVQRAIPRKDLQVLAGLTDRLAAQLWKWISWVRISGVSSAAGVSPAVAAFDFARCRAALARLPHVAMSHQRRRPVREVS